MAVGYSERGGRPLNWWVGRRLCCWVGEYWTAVREKGETTAALLGGRGLGCSLVRGMDDGCAAGWKDGTTATLLSWRESDCWAGEERRRLTSRCIASTPLMNYLP